MTYTPNRYQAPQAPLHSDYQPPSPPRYAVPGTKDVKSKAGNIALSLVCGVVLIWLWRSTEPYAGIDPAWRLLVLPLLLGSGWPFLPMLGDWFAVLHLRAHSQTYNYTHRIMAEEATATTEEWSQKHNSTAKRTTRVTLHTPQEDQLRAELARAQRERDQPTQALDRYTADMRRVVEIALGNEVRIVSDRRAQAAGMTQRAYLEARSELVKAGILYQADNGYFYLADGYSSHDQITERLAA